MSEQLPFTIDGQPARRARLSRKWTVTAAAAAVLTLGGGAVAYAASQGPSGPAGAGYGYRAAPGEGAGGPAVGHGPGRGAHSPQLDGTVKSVAGGKILITDFDGFTRTIKVSASTTYSGGLTASPKIGTRIHAEGKVDADGVSLAASLVGPLPARGNDNGSGPPPWAGRAGGPGWPGHPGKPGKHGTPSQSASSPAPSTSPS